VIYNGMPYDPIQGQDSRSRSKLGKWPISKSLSSTSMHVITRLMVNFDTLRQYVNFNRTDF